MKFVSTSLLAISAISLVLGGCASLSQATGASKARPDEFRVLTKAPLEIPPEFNLLPPRPGEPRPQDLEASQAARIAMLGGDGLAASTVGEQVLVASARGDLVDNSIRAQLNSETNRQIAKSNNFADRILFWRDGDTYIEDGTMLDADAEAERLRRVESANKATGAGDVVIRKKRRGIKLPGL